MWKMKDLILENKIIMDPEKMYYERVYKCLIVPIKRNGAILWKSTEYGYYPDGFYLDDTYFTHDSKKQEYYVYHNGKLVRISETEYKEKLNDAMNKVIQGGYRAS